MYIRCITRLCCGFKVSIMSKIKESKVENSIFLRSTPAADHKTNVLKMTM